MGHFISLLWFNTEAWPSNLKSFSSIKLEVMTYQIFVGNYFSKLHMKIPMSYMLEARETHTTERFGFSQACRPQRFSD